MPMVQCSECGAEVSDRAKSCPACGAPGPGAILRRLPLTKWWFWVLLFIGFHAFLLYQELDTFRALFKIF